MTLHPVPILGYVVSTQGTTPGPAAGISYTIDWILPSGKQQIAGQVPSDRQTGNAVDIFALEDGTPVQGFLVGTPAKRTIRWFAREIEAAEAACEEEA